MRTQFFIGDITFLLIGLQGKCFLLPNQLQMPSIKTILAFRSLKEWKQAELGSGGSKLSANDEDRHSKMTALPTVVPFWSMLERAGIYSLCSLSE